VAHGVSACEDVARSYVKSMLMEFRSSLEWRFDA